MRYRFETPDPLQSITLEAESFDQAIEIANTMVSEKYTLVFADDAETTGMICFELVPDEAQEGVEVVKSYRRFGVVDLQERPRLWLVKK